MTPKTGYFGNTDVLRRGTALLTFCNQVQCNQAFTMDDGLDALPGIVLFLEKVARPVSSGMSLRMLSL